MNKKRNEVEEKISNNCKLWIHERCEYCDCGCHTDGLLPQDEFNPGGIN